MERYYVCEPTQALALDKMQELLAIHCTDTGETYNSSPIWKTPFGFEVCVCITPQNYLYAYFRRGSGGSWIYSMSFSYSSSSLVNVMNVSSNFMTLGCVYTSYGWFMFRHNNYNYLVFMNSTGIYSVLRYEDGLNASSISIDYPAYKQLVNNQIVILDSIVGGTYCDVLRVMPVNVSTVTPIGTYDYNEILINGVNHLYIRTGGIILKDS